MEKSRNNVKCFVTTKMPASQMKTRDKDFVAVGYPDALNALEETADTITIAVSESQPNLAETIAKTKRFAINFVGEDIANKLQKIEQELVDGDPSVLDAYNFIVGELGNPVLQDAIAWYDYTVHQGPQRVDGKYVFTAERARLH